jgi:hypothetical protein
MPGKLVMLRFSLTLQQAGLWLKAGERLCFGVGSPTGRLRRDQSHGRAQFDMQTPHARNR